MHGLVIAIDMYESFRHGQFHQQYSSEFDPMTPGFEADTRFRGSLCEGDLELVGLDQCPERLHDTQELAVVALHPFANVASFHLRKIQEPA